LPRISLRSDATGTSALAHSAPRPVARRRRNGKAFRNVERFTFRGDTIAGERRRRLDAVPVRVSLR